MFVTLSCLSYLTIWYCPPLVASSIRERTIHLVVQRQRDSDELTLLDEKLHHPRQLSILVDVQDVGMHLHHPPLLPVRTRETRNIHLKTLHTKPPSNAFATFACVFWVCMYACTCVMLAYCCSQSFRASCTCCSHRV